MTKNTGRGFFVTGTDTGIGKTYVSRLLLQAFGEEQPATYMKPVQTGCLRNAQGDLVASDLDFVMRDNDLCGTMDDHVPYRFEPACSPHLAAARAGVVISIDRIREKYCLLSSMKSITVVEGAGGVLAPISETASMIDLMLCLDLPVILVTSPRVGTINQTLLTLEALARRGIVPVGLIVNSITDIPEEYIFHDTCRMLRNSLPSAAFLAIDTDSELTDSVRDFCHAI
ncbi:MAG: dethiobiotin synthase [Chitinispirillaceae bacterium]|jgi:dethiobiotin synthetase|nr:dethiobiotin synthase [Chitinispirillaceae bacterium]